MKSSVEWPKTVLQTFFYIDEKLWPYIFFSRGMIACALVFIGYGVSQAKDGPIVWPHPGRLLYNWLSSMVACISEKKMKKISTRKNSY